MHFGKENNLPNKTKRASTSRIFVFSIQLISIVLKHMTTDPKYTQFNISILE